MEIILPFLSIILLGFSAYFSSSEVALFSLSTPQVKVFQKSRDYRKHLIAKLIHRSRDLLVTVFIMNTLVNILLQNTFSSMFQSFSGWALKVGFPLLLTLIFGEIIPKNYGLQNNISLAQKVAPSIYWIQKALEPIRKGVVFLTQFVSQSFFFYLRKGESISQEELIHALQASKASGVLTEEEADLALGYLNLQNKTVREVMRPKEDILYYSVNEPLSKLVYLFVDQECSRVPICEKQLDEVIGIISAKQYFINRQKINTPEDLQKFAEKPFFIPETISARILLKKFESTGKHFAIVVDEYGSISGIITDEDIAEVVVGDISDLRDAEVNYTKQSQNEIIASGKMDIVELIDIFDAPLPNPQNMVTVGGWLMAKLGEIPKVGSQIETESYLFKVLSSEPHKIKKIYIRHKKDRLKASHEL